MSYVDGFVVPVKKKRLNEYKRMAEKCSKIWREYGAIEYRECVADDVKWGKRTSFPRSVKARPGETVVFSYVTYPSRKVRDAANKKVMTDPRLKDMMDLTNPPFDMGRMFFGGFKTLVQASRRK